MSKNALSNYFASREWGKALGWSERDIRMAYNSLEWEDERREEKKKESHKNQPTQPVRELTPEEQKAFRFQQKLNIFRWVFLAAVIVFIIVGVWLTANNFFLY